MSHGFKICRKTVTILALTILAALAGLCLLGKNVRAEDFAASGDGWTLTDEGVLTITDSAAFNKPGWEQGEIAVTALVISGDVDSIPSLAFYQNSTLTSVDLGNVTSIGYYSFGSCKALTNIDLSKVTYIDSFGFSYCTGLTAVDISKVVTLENQAFLRCTSLTSVTADDLVTIDDTVFSGCSTLSTFAFKNSSKVTSVGSNAFAGCSSLTSIDLSNVTVLGAHAFYGCSNLASADLRKVTSVPDYAFYNCTLLSDLKLGKVTSVGDSSFYQCKVLPAFDLSNLTVIGNFGFAGCLAFTDVNLSNVTTIGSSAFSGCINLTDVTSLANVVSIKSGAFKSCTSLTTDLDLRNVDTIEQNTFNQCSITKVYLSDVNDVTIGETAFGKCGELTTVTGRICSVGNSAFSGCSNLETIDLSHLTDIGNRAFYNCYKFSSIDLSSIKTIGDYAFAGCTGMTTVLLGDGVCEISSGAFSRCNNLQTINLENITNVGSDAFNSCTSLETADLRSVITISQGAFNDSGLKTLTIGPALYSITETGLSYDDIETLYYIGSKSQNLWAPSFENATIIYLAFDVSFNVGSECTDEIEAQIVEINAKVTMPSADPQLDGFIFTGWYTDKQCKNAYDFDQGVTADMTLYAGWNKQIASPDSVFKGYSVSLEGDIGLNFFVKLPDEAGSDTYMKFTVSRSSLKQEYAVSEAQQRTVNNETYYVFKCKVPAKNMASQITAELISGSQTLATCQYSVLDYAEYIFEHKAQYADEAPLVDAMLRYGYCSAVYFGVPTGDYVQILKDYEALAEVEAEINAGDATHPTLYNRVNAFVTYLPDDLVFSGVSLSLESKTTLKLQFTNNTGKELRFFRADNNVELIPEVSGNVYVIRITDIPAHKLNDKYKVWIDIEGDNLNRYVEYTPMNYAQNVVTRELSATRTQELKNLMNVLYAYYCQADIYMKKHG